MDGADLAENHLRGTAIPIDPDWASDVCPKLFRLRSYGGRELSISLERLAAGLLRAQD